MLPAYQNASLNNDLAIKKQLVMNQKRRYSVIQDTQLLADTGLASQMNVAIQSNLVTLEALLAEASAHYSASVMNGEIGYDGSIADSDSWDDRSLRSSDLYSDTNYSGSEVSGDNINDVTRVIQQGYVDKSLISSMKSIMIVANQLKQNVGKLQPVINYLNKGDIANLINQIEQVSDRYTDIFTTAQDITSLNLEKVKEEILGKFLIQVEKSIQPVFQSLNSLINSYSPAVVAIPAQNQGRNPDGGYNLASVMASNSM
jgi:hypothetical protein